MADILLDPGHGGIDSGAVSKTGLKEKDVNLKIALKVGKLLTDRNVSVAYTRTTDILLGNDINADLRERVRISNQVVKPKYFISIHNNSFTPDAKGTETYVVGFGGNAEKMAKQIHPSLLSATGLYNRGIKTANFYVLRYTDCPACLLEIAFLSNDNEAKLLADDNFLDKAAEGIAKGICTQLGKEWKLATKITDSWQWAINKGIVEDKNKTKEVEAAVELLYGLNHTTVPNPIPTPTPPIVIPKKNIYEYIGTTHVIRVDPMSLKCKDMVLKSGQQLIKEFPNFINANLFLHKNGIPTKTIGWLISEGKVLFDRHEYLTWKGNPKGTLLVYKNGKVEVGWKWDSDIVKVVDDIWFCVQGFSLFEEGLNVKEILQKEGFVYNEVGRTTERLSIGYDGKDIVIAARASSNAERAVTTMENLGCKGNAICLDGGGSTNMAHNGSGKMLTSRLLAGIIYW